MPDEFSFSELPEPLQQSIGSLGWKDPMPVQARVVPLMRSGKDLIVQAQTGSGKTGAFGIPLVVELDPELRACQALVLVPTRELAGQVANEIAQLGRASGIHCVPIYGGVGYAQQIEAIEAGTHVIVGTPGRVLDHLGSGRLPLDAVRVLVLDEADEMLSLGFWPDMREINSYLPKKRQSCLFSATIPEKVRSLSRVFLVDPTYVSLSSEMAPQEIEHFYVLTTAQDKEQNLVRILEYEEPESAIIFCNTKDDVRYVTAYLQRRGFDADAISGDLSQAAREQAMARIKAGKLRFLVATDVAARGIDISDLSHVIGYTTPATPEVYVHRTGRTGRAGKAGTAISLVSGFDIGNFKMIQVVNKIRITERKVPTASDIAARHAERLAVKVEQELRALPDRERAALIERFTPIVQTLGATPEGQRDLAAICGFYMREHQPVTTVDTGAATASAPTAAAADDPYAQRGPRRDGGSRGGGGGGGGRRRRGGSRRGGGGGGGGRR
jgi:ATP-dependent RNA helicase DeaD